jgi:hypothetical protein
MLMICYWKLKMVKCEKNHVWNCAPFSMYGWPSGSIIAHNFSNFVIHVMWRITRCNNHVDLWILFQRMTYGLSYTTICEGSNKRLCMFIMHQIDMFYHFVISFSIRIWTCSWFKERCNLVEHKGLQLMFNDVAHITFDSLLIMFRTKLFHGLLVKGN